MNHQPFKGWLLSEDELSVEQANALRDHLRTCDACNRIESSWKELEAIIDRSAQLEPVSGFVERWQVRLVEHHVHQQKLRGWYTIGATALIVISLMVLLIMQIWSLVQAPGPYLAAWFDRFVGVLSIFLSIRSIASSISLPGPIYALAGMVLLVGLISFMSVLWLATYRKISLARREV